MNILHITPHLGGGMGTVILKYVEKDSVNNSHLVLSLDRNNNKDWTRLSGISNITILDNAYTNIRDLISVGTAEVADIVIIHWFNHPLLFDFLVNVPLKGTRVAIWNHVSGLYPPYVHSQRLIEYADRFLFTSPISFQCKEIIILPAELKKKLGTIWSTCGTDDYKDIRRKDHDGFIVGYTGTADYGKLHNDFIKMCSKIKGDDIRFVVCSGDSQKHLVEEAEKAGIQDRFSFMGRVPSVIPYLLQYDVFGYPLQRNNFATCEQAIGEAMMAGAVPVVLNNLAESYIVDHMVNGIVAKNSTEYAISIQALSHHRDILEDLSRKAREKAMDLYDADKTVKEWQTVFDELMELPRADHVWTDGTLPVPAYMLYALSLGVYGKAFTDYVVADLTGDPMLLEESSLKIQDLFMSNSMFRSGSKGSPIQYLRFFEDDKYLAAWSEIAKAC